MAYEVASIFTLKDNFTSHLKEMIGNQNKFRTDTKHLSNQLNSTYNTLKKESKLAGTAMSKALKEAQKEFNATGKHSEEMKRKIRDTVAQKVKLQFDTDSIKTAEKELKKVEKQIKNINNEKISPKSAYSSGSGSSIFKNALGVASGIGIYNMAASSINTAEKGLEYALQQAGQREQSAIAFETMLKSRQKGQRMVRDLTSFAISTPFEYGDLERNATFALAMGFKDNDIISLITDVGNASAGLSKGSDGVESMVRALGQMQNKGKVSMEEINQLSENGVKALEYLSNATGKTKAEMMKYIEKGLVPADKAIKAIRKGMRDDFGGMMIKQSKTLFGLFSNIKDFVSMNVFGKFGEGIRQGIIPALSKFVDKLTGGKEGIAKLEDKLISMGKSIGEFVANNAVKLEKYIEELFSDEKFKSADLGGKIKRVLNDIYTSMNDWYEGGGKNKINSFFTSLTKGGISILTSVLSSKDTINNFISLGTKIGNSIMDGMTNALKQKIPFGENWSLQWGYVTPFVDKVKGNKSKESDAGSKSKSWSPMWGFATPFVDKITGKSRAMGVTRVPRDNYPIIAHEGEQLLTKQEAGSRKVGSITINKLADQIVVREEADIDKIADALLKKINQARYAYGGAH